MENTDVPLCLALALCLLISFNALKRETSLQGGMGEAAAEALRCIHAALGLEAARAFYRQLQRLPPAGGAFVHAVLDMESEVPPAEQLPDAAMEAVFEVRTAAHSIRAIACADKPP